MAKDISRLIGTKDALIALVELHDVSMAMKKVRKEKIDLFFQQQYIERSLMVDEFQGVVESVYEEPSWQGLCDAARSFGWEVVDLDKNCLLFDAYCLSALDDKNSAVYLQQLTKLKEAIEGFISNQEVVVVYLEREENYAAAVVTEIIREPTGRTLAEVIAPGFTKTRLHWDPIRLCGAAQIRLKRRKNDE